MNCPSNALYCEDEEDVLGAEIGEKVVRQELVVGIPVEVLLDTGCVQTLVWRELVLESKVLVGETAVVQCAHMVSVGYPLAELEIALGKKPMVV